MFNKRLRIVVTVVLTLSLMLLASPAAYAVPTPGGVGGTFQIGNTAPTVTAVELYSDAALQVVATDMTPLTKYYAKVTAGDANYINNIDEVRLELFYDATPSDPVAPGVANTQNNAIFTWTKSGSVWAISAGAGTTWTIVTAECVEPATMVNLSGDWVFAFTVGKVAAESSALTGNWDMYGKATDVEPLAGEMYNRDKDILFYSEVTAVTAIADWGMVTADTGFADDVNEVTAIAITYIANGDYSASVMAANWDGNVGGAGAATYMDVSTTLVAQEFSLMADTDATFIDAVQVLLAGAVVDNTGIGTAEAGDATTTNTLWLKLGTTFINDVYSGSITYIIANR